MNTEQKRARALHAAIAAILFEEWNPIGCAVPRDEYDSYVGGLYRLLVSGATVPELAARLERLERESMGLAHGSPAVALRAQAARAAAARKLHALEVRRGAGKRDDRRLVGCGDRERHRWARAAGGQRQPRPAAPGRAAPPPRLPLGGPRLDGGLNLPAQGPSLQEHDDDRVRERTAQRLSPEDQRAPRPQPARRRRRGRRQRAIRRRRRTTTSTPRSPRARRSPPSGTRAAAAFPSSGSRRRWRATRRTSARASTGCG